MKNVFQQKFSLSQLSQINDILTPPSPKKKIYNKILNKLFFLNSSPIYEKYSFQLFTNIDILIC